MARRNSGDIIDMNNDGLDDRLYLWRQAIARRVGFAPDITDGLRSYSRQRQYWLAGYGNNPDNAPHVEGRALDLRTRGTGISMREWERIAMQAARDIGLTDVRAIAHRGTAEHLHLEVGEGGSMPHTPDGCPSCRETGMLFADDSQRNTRRAPGLGIGINAEIPGLFAFNAGLQIGGNTRRPAAIPIAADSGLMSGYMPFANPRSAMDDPFRAIFRDGVDTSGTRPFLNPIDVPQDDAYPMPGRYVPTPFARPRIEATPVSYTPVTTPTATRSRALSGLLPTGAQQGTLLPDKAEAQRFANMTGRRGQPISLGENRLALQGETRAAILHTLMTNNGGNLSLADLRNVSSWGADRAAQRAVIDQFITSKGLDATTVYNMLGNSETILQRRDPALFAGGSPATIADLFARAQTVEERRLGISPGVNPGNAVVPGTTPGSVPLGVDLTPGQGVVQNTNGSVPLGIDLTNPNVVVQPRTTTHTPITI